MGEKEIHGGITGLVSAEYKRVDSFPTNINKNEVLIHEITTKKNVIFLAFYVEDGIPKCKEIHLIKK